MCFRGRWATLRLHRSTAGLHLWAALRRHSTRAAALLAVVCAVTLAFSPVPASADAVSDKRAEAQRIAAKLDDLGSKESRIAEQYDGALLAQDAANVAVGTATRDAAAADAKAAAANADLSRLAVAAYINGPAAGGVLTGSDPGVAIAYQRSVAGDKAQALDIARAARIDQAAKQARLRSAKAKADGVVASLATLKKQVADAESELKATQATVQGELATLVAQAQADRLAAQAADAQRALTAAKARATAAPVAAPRAPGAPAPKTPLAPIAAPRPGAAAAVNFAQAQLGKPYQWGASGPGSYDCSGLTMRSWGAGGVGLPHNAAAQYNSIRHVPLSDVQVGDLLFNPDLGHVGIYIGGGQMIHAPHTGDVVRVSPIRGNTLVGRP